jgi:hypothetical protein
MTEKIEAIAMALRLLVNIVCGVTLITGIWSNTTRKKKNGDPMKNKQNSRKGSHQDALGFLGSCGAIVFGVEAHGNRVALLLRAHDDNDWALLRWNLRQGGALDWFIRHADGTFRDYPATSNNRLAACFFFQGLDLDPQLAALHEQIVLGQIDCTSTPNLSEWELRRIFPDPRRGWLSREFGVPSMLDTPRAWIQAVIANAKQVAAKFPQRPVVIWIGAASVWEGTGFKSKSELLYRFALATG